MIEGSCHCGAIRFRLARPPEKLTDCNCSACRRYRALWAHVRHEEVEVFLGGPVVRYTHGERGLAFVSCATCGGTTHWEPNNGKRHDRGHMAVNAAMLAPGVVAGIPVRRFDGADTWEYLD
jgi:hypothetical protein